MNSRRGRKKRPTLIDVAREAGVSIASVSNYLHDYPYMSVTIRDAIEKAVQKLGYIANESARTLRSGKTGLITLSLPDLRQIYFAELAEEVIKSARGRGYSVIISSTSNNKEREMRSISSVVRSMTDGLIISPVHMDPADISAFSGDYPLVMLGERVFGAPAPHVVVDNVDASRTVVRHLLSAGCRRIAVVGGSLTGGVSSRLLRTEGYKQELEAQGIGFDPLLIDETESWTTRSGAEAIRRLNDRGVRFDAVFALNDLIGWGVISQLKELGYRIPRDVRVVGFDSLEESAYTIPSLTSVDPLKKRIAECAVELLVEEIETGQRAEAKVHSLGFEVLYRDSSPRVED